MVCHSNMHSGKIGKERTLTVTEKEEVIRSGQEMEVGAEGQLGRQQETHWGLGSWKLREQMLQEEWSTVQVGFPFEFSSLSF